MTAKLYVWTDLVLFFLANDRVTEHRIWGALGLKVPASQMRPVSPYEDTKEIHITPYSAPDIHVCMC